MVSTYVLQLALNLGASSKVFFNVFKIKIKKLFL